MSLMLPIQLNKNYQIDGFQGDPVVLERLSEIGLRRDKIIMFTAKLPLGGPYVARFDQTQFSLREEEVQCLKLSEATMLSH